MLAGALAFSLVSAAGWARGAAPMLFEAENFPAQGAWQGESDRDCLGNGCLRGGTGQTGPGGEALTVFQLGEDASVEAWVRSKNYLENLSGKRRFALAVDGVRAEREGGLHGREGWAWERVGTFRLKAGPHVLSLLDTSQSYARCDAIVLAPAGFDPAKLGQSALTRLRVPLDCGLVAPPGLRPATVASPKEFRPGAEIRGERVRSGFSLWDDLSGRKVLARRVEMRSGDGWATLPVLTREMLFVTRAAPDGVDAQAHARPDHPRWRAGGALALPGGRSVPLKGLTKNPFMAAGVVRLDPVGLRQAGDMAVDVSYAAADGLRAEGRWSIGDAGEARLEVRLTAPSDGFYSIGFCAFDAVDRGQVEAIQLPPLYQYQRLPDGPCLLTSSVTPNPLALVQRKLGDAGTVAWGITAEPEALPFRWSGRTNAVCAFGLLNAVGEVQPVAVSPVLGFEGSARRAGEEVRARFRLLAVAGDWKEALDRACLGIFGVRDYRAPVNVSLTSAVRNMKRLMEDDVASGWDAPKRGFYDIETAAMSKHAAPLVLPSLARLFGDETFWWKRALPTIEFTLSRKTAHCIHADKDRKGNPVRDQLKVPTDFYGTSYWQGIDWLTDGLNPWLREFALPGGEPKVSRGYNTAPPWTEDLAAWRYTRDPEWLRKARGGADKFVADVVFGQSHEVVPFDAFYNIHFYPYWWELVDLFEVTGERRYLDAAREGAYHTLAGLWSHPRVPSGEMTVHPGGEQWTPERVWFRDGETYRLGWPRRPGDTPERTLPAWQVAQVGIGLEQPSTLTGSPEAMRNIMMSSWSPHLMRVHQHGGGELLLAQARNGVIGRFANYPGYYLPIYTDMVHQPRYPYEGPDLTSFYYHHIPVHAGWALDFLVAQLANRSGGRVSFPYAVQKNYAWFTFRVYGGGPGRAFDDGTARLTFDPEGVARVAEPMVDWLTARGEGRYWIFLMGQDDREMRARVHVGMKTMGVEAGEPWVIRDEMGRGREVAGAEAIEVALPAKGFRAIEIPREAVPDGPVLSPLACGHAKAPLPGPWREAHAFRIRSPFGRDGVYAVVIAKDEARGSVEFEIVGGGARAETDAGAPFEFSAYPVDPSCDVTVRVSVRDAAGTSLGSADLVLRR